MSGSVNKVILVGRLGKDPETMSFSNGGEVVKFSLATSETWKDKQTGEKKERTDWHNIAVYAQGLAGIAKQYLRKGSLVYVEGQLQTREYEKDGVKKWFTEVALKPYNSAMHMLGGRNDARSEQPAQSSASGHDAPPPTTNDDDIPF